MSLDFKIVVDARDPHRLAAFWATALGYEPEDNSALVRRALDAGLATDDDVTTVGGRLAWRTAAAVRHPDDPVDPRSGTGLGRRLLFQSVPEPKVAKNRMHLDLHVGDRDLGGEVARLQAAGATLLYEVDAPHSHHVTLADPEGNEFCVQ
jgi:catechol 2,3-dioxygenase-like lactoylglutathione lyase family enzyme